VSFKKISDTHWPQDPHIAQLRKLKNKTLGRIRLQQSKRRDDSLSKPKVLAPHFALNDAYWSFDRIQTSESTQLLSVGRFFQ
jgi:hypothetical protein